MRLESHSNKSIVLSFTAHEIVILHQLLGSITALLEQHEGQDSTDAALARLFPNAYENNEDSLEFREMTEESLVNQKLEDVCIIQNDLRNSVPDSWNFAGTELDGEVQITKSTLDNWIRGLNTIRLTLAARMGILTVEDLNQVRQNSQNNSTVALSDWLAMVVETLLHYEPFLKA